MAHPNLLDNNRQAMDTCRRWDAFCTRLFHACQDLALEEVNRSDKYGYTYIQLLSEKNQGR